MTCLRKVWFDTLANAERARTHLEANKGKFRLDSFFCKKCGGYHHGHASKLNAKDRREALMVKAQRNTELFRLFLCKIRENLALNGVVL